MDTSLPEDLERQRRATLHRQIAALTREIELLDQPQGRSQVVRLAKLKNKRCRLEFELRQPMLIDLRRLGGSGDTT
jgi:hypothetical protein